ncbi:unnamed protein product, partial [Rotaria magnacalcarata]
MSNQDPTSTNNRRTKSNFNKINQHVTSLFDSTDV